MKYRKKPVVVEAMQLTKENWPDVLRFCGNPAAHMSHENSLLIHTLEGTMRADCGDWVIKGTRGEFYPCKPDAFADTFEPADAVTCAMSDELTSAVRVLAYFTAFVGILTIYAIFSQKD